LDCVEEAAGTFVPFTPGLTCAASGECVLARAPAPALSFRFLPLLALMLAFGGYTCLRRRHAADRS
ncbi:MAG TPA: hypothetical protein VN812_07935, partial [Candidatus Acidoferrales bacterium]|nr:hypothetical protein [Candidatus Acidoferrales bacterium]